MAAKQVLHYLFMFSIHASAMNSPLTINILLINPWHAVNHKMENAGSCYNIIMLNLSWVTQLTFLHEQNGISELHCTTL